MIGISKERLVQIANETHDSDDTNMAVLSLLDMLIKECQELQEPWTPIDESTPKDRELLLFFPERSEFNLTANKQIAICNDSYLNHCFIKPTHYQELPDDPEPGDKNG